MTFLLKDKLFSKKWFTDYLLIIVGSFILATGYVYFVSPHKIVPGGVYGIAIVVHHLTKGIFSFWPEGFPIGLFGLLINIPLTIAGIKILGPRFGIKTIVGFVLASVFITGRAIDMTIEGSDYHKALLIISKKHNDIKHKLLYDLERGGTYLKGEGLYTGEEKQIIYTVVSRREVAILESYINRIDPNAFITVMDTREILGEGFQNLKKKIEDD